MESIAGQAILCLENPRTLFSLRTVPLTFIMLDFRFLIGAPILHNKMDDYVPFDNIFHM